MDLGFGPDQRLGVGVVGLDEGIDMRSELFDRGEGSSAMGSSGTSAYRSSTRIRCCQRRPPCAPHSIACRNGSSKWVSRWGATAHLFQTSPNRRGYTCEAQVAAEALNPDDKSQCDASGPR